MRESEFDDGGGAIGVGLRGLVPKVFREALLGDEEPGLRPSGGVREGQRERNVDVSAGSPAPAREVETRPVADPALGKRPPVGLRVVRAQHQHGEALPLSQEIVEKAGEREHGILGRGPHEAFAAPDQFEKGAVELHDMVFGAPGVAIARADLEAEASVALGGGVEVAEGDDEVVERAGHAVHVIGDAGHKEPP